MRNRAGKIAAAVAVSATALLLGARATKASERESVGYVFDSTGDWRQDGVKFPHKAGDPVYARAFITHDPGDKEVEKRGGAAIIINLFDGKREERSTEQPATFTKPIQLPVSLGNQSSAFSRLLRAMGALFSKEPEKYLITTVRGTDDLQLHDAVIELKNSEIDLRPVFKNAPSGKYAVRLRPNDTGLRNQNALDETFTFEWRAEANQGLAVPNISSGLWRLEVVQPDGSLATDAWVLVETSAAYDGIVDLFDKAVAVTRQWGRSASENEVRSFLRTALDAVGRERRG
jgi:hypothetical protein